MAGSPNQRTMRSRCGSTDTTTCGTTPARRHEPSAPSTATIVPAYPLLRRRTRLSRRCKLGPAPITTALSPSLRLSSANSRIECLMRGWLTAALSSPTPAIRSNVAACRRLAIRLPRSIRLHVRARRRGLPVALPEEAFFADEADAATEPRKRLLFELVRRARLGRRRLLDHRLQLVVALEKLFHADPPQ